MNLVKPSYGIVVIDKQANTLLVQQYGKSWCPPKGRMEKQDHDNPILTASRELREETGYVSGVNRVIPSLRGGGDRILFAPSEPHPEHGWYKYLSTTITRRTFMGKPEPGWFGPHREFTYYLGLCEDLHKVDFSGVRDKAITDMKIVSTENWAGWSSGTNHFQTGSIGGKILHGEDFKAICRLHQMAIKQYQRKAQEDAKKN